MIANCIFAILRGGLDVILIFWSYAVFKDYAINYSVSKGTLGKIIGVVVIALFISFSLSPELEGRIELFAKITLAGVLGIYDGVRAKYN